jgi:hypothetical protein
MKKGKGGKNPYPKSMGGKMDTNMPMMPMKKGK